MSFDYRNQLGFIQQLFQTTTSLDILNTGLTGTVNSLVTADKIRIGDPLNLPTMVDAYPQIIINLEQSNEVISEINMSSGRRTITNQIGIYCLAYIASDSDSSDKACHILTKNAQTIIRANFIKNTYWDSANIGLVDFKGGYVEPGKKDTYQSSSKINMEYKQLFT